MSNQHAMDQYLKEAYANVITNQFASGPTWQDAQQAMAQLKNSVPLSNMQQSQPRQVYSYTLSAGDYTGSYGFGTYGAPEAQRAVVAAPKPAESAPAPLTYQEFHDIATNVVKTHCPKARLVTDRRGDSDFIAWLAFGKWEREYEADAKSIAEEVKAGVAYLCETLILRTGAKALR